MIETIWQRLDHSGRLALPLVTALVCALLGSIVWPLPYLGAVAPPLALMTIYYWALHRPDLFRPGMAFAIGLLNDIVNFLPIGLSALLFVVAHQIVFRQRRYFVGHSFFMMWAGFILTVCGVMSLQWLLLNLIRWQIYPVIPVVMQAAFAVALFPLPCWLLIALQRLALNAES
jgi:rod shape-determining protein MreD